jgi:hypothetical protein
LEAYSELRRCAVFCAHCGIRFLTHPCNAGRKDLGCPFGCRKTRTRQRSNERSKKHYRSPKGRRNKKKRNAFRTTVGGRTVCEPPPPDPARVPRAPAGEPRSDDAPEAAEQRGDDVPEKAELRLEGVVLGEADVVHSPVLPYVRMVASLIEGIRFRLDEIVRLLLRTLRQRSLGHRTGTPYAWRFLHPHPPSKGVR